ncbi:MAG: glycosyltransferase, partial [Selenomonadaceae bacterium]|nr:glycosyltransferase [Selenomonadaceae bacterium]
KPELEYSLPSNSRFFSRITFKPVNNTLERFDHLYQYFKEYEVDIFISHHVWYKPALQNIFSKLSSTKILMHFHHELNYHIFGLNSIFVYRLADGLISLSKTRKEFWKNYDVHSYYLPLPVPIEGAEHFHGRNPKKCSNTILYVGRIAKADDKNTFAILPILNEVVKVIPNVKLKILGEVYNEEVFVQMKNFIAKNHLEGNVEFCGYQTNVRPFYEESDVILGTSPTEGWSLFVIESKFYELPLVLYELPGVEFLSDGKGYIAVPQGDFRAAVQAILKILTDTDLRCKLSAEARESIQPFLDYDIEGAWKKIFDDLENDAPIPPHNIENEQIQTFLLKEIWKSKMQLQALIAQLQTKV